MTNSKVVEINLEDGNPTITTALQKMKNGLATYRGQGYKAVVVIHGYGSSGVGGGIKPAVRRCLEDNSMRGIVRMFVGGEDWINNKRAALAVCESLKSHERKISSNEGITVVVLR